jgi:hypothetical protein
MSSCSRHRHIVVLHTAFEDADAVHLVLDLYAGGDLLSLVSAQGGSLRSPRRPTSRIRRAWGGRGERLKQEVGGGGRLGEGRAAEARRGVGAQLGLGLGGGRFIDRSSD